MCLVDSFYKNLPLGRVFRKRIFNYFMACPLWALNAMTIFYCFNKKHTICQSVPFVPDKSTKEIKDPSIAQVKAIALTLPP